MHRLITDTDTLRAVCERFAHCEYVTVDTEFIREKTYYPKLCLIQLASAEDEVAVDPLAKDIDLSPLFALLANPSVVKVFHAAKQDVEIFYQLTGTIPTPLYDTQIAAMVCGYGESIGYEALVNTIVSASLDKASRYTDWEQRPLTQRQVDYAIADVTHLRGVYESLRDQIAQQGRTDWIAEEMAQMGHADSYEVHPEEMWRRLKYNNRSSSYLNLLRAAAAWRERTAMRKDIPRGRLLKDEVLLQIASMNPKTVEDMAQVRGALKHISGDNAKSLLEALEEARSLPKEAHPKDEKRKKLLNADQDVIVDVLRMLLKLQSEKHHVATKLIANKEDLAALVLGKDVPCLHGWRFEVFGQLAQDFLSGQLQLRVDATGGVLFERSAG